MTVLPIVAVIDDDESVRDSLTPLLQELGYAVQAFRSAEEFLASDMPGQTRCLVLDVAMPGLSGPDLQELLIAQGRTIPIVFITAHDDERIRARVIAAGAVACLFKPFTGKALRDAVTAAVHA